MNGDIIASKRNDFRLHSSVILRASDAREEREKKKNKKKTGENAENRW